MPEFDVLSIENLKTLAEAEGPCATVVFKPGAIEAKDVARELTPELRARFPQVDEEAFLAPIHAGLRNPEFKAPRRGSVVLLRSPEISQQFCCPHVLKDTVILDDEFQVRVLLPLATDVPLFFILALSQKHTRLLRCTRTSVEEVALPQGVPTGLEESMATRKPDHTLDNRIAAGPSSGSSKGVMFGTSSDREKKDEYLLQFLKELDAGIQPLLRGEDAPLVVAAVEHEVALYRTVNSYAHLVEPGVYGAPDGLKGGEMHRRALELLDMVIPTAAHQGLENFEKQVGTGHASKNAQEIVKAAYEGRVAHLYFQENAEYRGEFDELRQKVKRSDDQTTRQRDLVNTAALQTLLHGGEVTVLPSAEMPNGVPICAVFRYAGAVPTLAPG